jgi:hypothetical protein
MCVRVWKIERERNIERERKRVIHEEKMGW